MQLIACQQTGSAWLDTYYPPPNLKIGYIACDRTWDDYREIADACGVDASSIKLRTLVDDPMISLKQWEHDTEAFRDALLSTFKDVDLLIIDPIGPLMRGDLNSYNIVAPLLISFNRWAKAHGVCIVGTHHTNKVRVDAKYSRPQDRASGSVAFTGYVGSQIILQVPEEINGPFHLLTIATRSEEAKSFHLVRSGQRGQFLEPPESWYEAYDKHGNKGLHVIRQFPIDGSLISREKLLEKIRDMSSRTLDRLLKGLQKDGLIAVPSYGSYCLDLTWSPADDD